MINAEDAKITEKNYDLQAQKTENSLYPQGEISEYPMNENSLYGVQFNASMPFGGIEIFIPTASEKNSITLSLYKWDGNYSKTIKNAPAQTKAFSNVKSGEWLRLESDCGKGEFLLVLSDGTEGMTVSVVEKRSNIANHYLHTSKAGVSLVCRTLKNAFLIEPSSPIPQDFISDDAFSWCGTDGLGRKLPTCVETGAPRDGKYVGLFYHTWHSAFAYRDVINVTELLKKHPDAKDDYNHPAWEGGTNCFWNEPLFGYYNNGIDRYVLRKHAELLANAGVDVVFFDNTNFTLNFMDAIFALCEVWAEARADGVKTPQISAMLNMYGYNDTATQIMELYEKLYSKGLYEDLWFYWEGKPLLLACPQELKKLEKGEEAFDFFTYRPIDPSYTEEHELTRKSDISERITFVPSEECSKYTMWKWISVYPQEKMYKKGTDKVEQMCVCVAQNWTEKQGLTPMSVGDKVFGRGYTNKNGENPSIEAAMAGLNFAEQWEYALKVDPEIIFITGWNEWQVGRYEEMWGHKNVLPDNATDCYSRDIEPSKGALKDHFYNQMVSYIRRFKGIGEQPSSSGVVINAGERGENISWAEITPVYRDYKGNTPLRDYNGYSKYHYVNKTGRNDFTEARVAYDDKNIYFMAETAKDITPHTDNGWMRLFIDVFPDVEGWETFDFVVNRISPTENEASLERSKGGWNWEKVCNVKYTVENNRMVITVPKASLGINGNSFTFNFKWSDNMQKDGDVMDFYENGNAAPGARFKYTFSSLDKK